MLVTLRSRRVKRILVSMSLDSPYKFWKHTFQIFLSVHCHFVVYQSNWQGKKVAQVFSASFSSSLLMKKPIQTHKGQK